MATPPPGHDCTGCPLGRREFLHDAATAAVAAALAIGGGRLDALPVRAISALRSSGSQVSYAIAPHDGVGIDRANDTMVGRVGAKVFVFARTCPHQNTALKWIDSASIFECPKHNSKYTPEGIFIEGRATRSLDRFAVSRQGSTVIADLDRLYQQDRDPAAWTAAYITVN